MNDIPAGYKQTEAGVIPEDWEVHTLRSCLSAQPDYGINAPAVPVSDKLPTYIRITDITEDGRFSHEKPVSVKRGDAHHYYLNAGDIVFARTGASVGKSYLYEPKDGKLVFAGFLIRVRPDAAKLVPAYLAGYVTTGAYWNWVRLMSMRRGQPGINGQEYGQLPIPLPPTIDEQRAIAAALSDVDALICAIDRLIAKKRDLKQAAMQQLLTGQKRLAEFGGSHRSFKQTEAGLLPEDWRLPKVKDVASITTGKRNTQDRIEDGQYPFFVRSHTVERINSYSFDGEAVLTAGDGVGTGKVFHYINGRFDFHQRVYKISDFSADLCGFYFYLYFSRNFFDRIMAMTAKSSVDSVRLDMIAEMWIPLPSLAEQTAIAEVLSDMDAELAALTQRRDKTRALKQGMMQELLTGRTRLV